MADKHGDGKNHGGKGKGGNQPATVKSLVRSLLGSNVVAPLTGGGLKKELRAGAQVRYAPLQHQLDAQLRAQKATQKRNKAYYNDYLQRVRGIQQQTGDIYGDANKQLAQAQQQAQGGDTAILAALNGNRQDQAQLLGAAPSDGANPLAQAQVARSQSALGNQARIIGQGATQKSYLADQRRIGQANKIDTLIQGQAKTESIRQDMEDLAREKGAFKTDMMRDLREGERQFLSDLLSGPNARKLAHIQGEEARKTDNNAAKHSSSSSGDPKNQGKNRGETRKEAKEAQRLIQATPPKPGTDWHKIAQYLIGQGISASIANRIAKRYAHKHDKKGGKGGVRGSVGGAIGGVGGAAGGHR